MTIVAQVTEAVEVLNDAASHSWEAALLASLVLGGFGFLGWMLKKVMSDSQSRENRMAARIDLLEAAELEMHKGYSDKLMSLTEKVTDAIAQSADAQRAMNQTLQTVTEVMRTVNGDLREMCSLLKMSPCLMLGTARGDYTLIDKEGHAVELDAFKHEARGEE